MDEPERQTLGSIEDGLAGSDPKLASMLNIFSQLTAGEEMPARGTSRGRPGRPRARGPRQGMALPDARQLYPRLGWPLAMFLLWAVISAALLAVALLLSTSGPKACAIVQLHPQAQMIGNTCPRANGGSGSPLGWLPAVSAAKSHL